MLSAFLASTSHTMMEPGFSVPMSEFHRNFVTFCILHDQKPPQWTPDYYMGVLESQSPPLRVETRKDSKYNDQVWPGSIEFIVGVDIALNIRTRQSSARAATTLVDAERMRKLAESTRAQFGLDKSAASGAPSTATPSPSLSTSPFISVN